MYSVTEATLLLIYPFLGSSILALAVLSFCLINRGRGPLYFLSATHSSLLLHLDDPALERRRHLRTSPLLRHRPLHQPVVSKENGGDLRDLPAPVSFDCPVEQICSRFVLFFRVLRRRP